MRRSTPTASTRRPRRARQQEAVKRDAVASTLRFVDKFPKHEHAAAVLGTAVDDLYEMKEFARAIATGQQLIDGYPDADPAIRRSAWTVVAHSSFETAAYPQAEQAYARVLEMTRRGRRVAPGRDRQPRRLDLQAGRAGRTRRRTIARRPITSCASRRPRPRSSIRPSAEYDAGAALMQLEGLGRRRHGARRVPQGLSGARAATARPPSRSRS